MTLLFLIGIGFVAGAAFGTLFLTAFLPREESDLIFPGTVFCLGAAFIILSLL